jgi:hypothetical protein
LLDSTNRRFATLMLSHLPARRDVLWDEFYKVKHLERLAQSRNPLRYIISQPPLRYALWLTLLGVLILLLFQTKRKQRIIPLIPPLPNSTLEFTETVGRLYFQHGDHRNLAQKKIRYWLEHLRSQYLLNTEQFTPDFIASLAARSGISEEMAASLCREIDRLRGQTRISAEELSDLSSKLEIFYEQSQGQATPASSNRIT